LARDASSNEAVDEATDHLPLRAIIAHPKNQQGHTAWSAATGGYI
jgi:hypothetical protein